MARPRARSSAEVSSGNPCPFLRALVAEGRGLFVDRRLPRRMVARLPAATPAAGR